MNVNILCGGMLTRHMFERVYWAEEWVGGGVEREDFMFVS